MENNVATTTSNSHYITKSQPFYYGEQFKSWANTPMSYALDIAIENYIADVLEFSLDRIIYASNFVLEKELEKMKEIQIFHFLIIIELVMMILNDLGLMIILIDLV